jgi:hypothetical protein
MQTVREQRLKANFVSRRHTIKMTGGRTNRKHHEVDDDATALAGDDDDDDDAADDDALHSKAEQAPRPAAAERTYASFEYHWGGSFCDADRFRRRKSMISDAKVQRVTRWAGKS